MGNTLFPYDSSLAALTQVPQQSIAGVIQTLQTIDATCIEGDGLKWFNLLYLQVTKAVNDLVNAGGFQDSSWLAELDFQFANLFLAALHGYLSGGTCPGCWAALFGIRDHTRIARIQFALAGVNAHINHDLPEAIVTTCKARGIAPQHGTPQYADYTAVNAPLDALIETAKKVLHVRLLGDPLPAVSHLEDMVAAWGTTAAREKAWNQAEVLWHLQGLPAIAAGYLDGLDGVATFANKVLLAPVA